MEGWREFATFQEAVCKTAGKAGGPAASTENAAAKPPPRRGDHLLFHRQHKPQVPSPRPAAGIVTTTCAGLSFRSNEMALSSPDLAVGANTVSLTGISST
jgi:hypothetical protein